MFYVLRLGVRALKVVVIFSVLVLHVNMTQSILQSIEVVTDYSLQDADYDYVSNPKDAANEQVIQFCLGSTFIHFTGVCNLEVVL